ncbi:hypothetical protein VHEMI02755 [[Torrubiella] hemipterigena]|uniref:Uncharacterized protein n=1 Tax=[Torrubiella] hemipterigena TaxID=1531966 RepID=A0A0A1SWQ5_9HYPO|nr:hypothetical protein VHEMI02755 [[Torrubiella] hemipterigena]
MKLSFTLTLSVAVCVVAQPVANVARTKFPGGVGKTLFEREHQASRGQEGTDVGCSWGIGVSADDCHP